jgi:hypothetical protein
MNILSNTADLLGRVGGALSAQASGGSQGLQQYLAQQAQQGQQERAQDFAREDASRKSARDIRKQIGAESFASGERAQGQAFAAGESEKTRGQQALLQSKGAVNEATAATLKNAFTTATNTEAYAQRELAAKTTHLNTLEQMSKADQNAMGQKEYAAELQSARDARQQRYTASAAATLARQGVEARTEARNHDLQKQALDHAHSLKLQDKALLAEEESKQRVKEERKDDDSLGLLQSIGTDPVRAGTIFKRMVNNGYVPKGVTQEAFLESEEHAVARDKAIRNIVTPVDWRKNLHRDEVKQEEATKMGSILYPNEEPGQRTPQEVAAGARKDTTFRSRTEVVKQSGISLSEALATPTDTNVPYAESAATVTALAQKVGKLVNDQQAITTETSTAGLSESNSGLTVARSEASGVLNSLLATITAKRQTDVAAYAAVQLGGDKPFDPRSAIFDVDGAGGNGEVSAGMFDAVANSPGVTKVQASVDQRIDFFAQMTPEELEHLGSKKLGLPEALPLKNGTRVKQLLYLLKKERGAPTPPGAGQERPAEDEANALTQLLGMDYLAAQTALADYRKVGADSESMDAVVRGHSAVVLGTSLKGADNPSSFVSRYGALGTDGKHSIPNTREGRTAALSNYYADKDNDQHLLEQIEPQEREAYINKLKRDNLISKDTEARLLHRAQQFDDSHNANLSPLYKELSSIDHPEERLRIQRKFGGTANKEGEGSLRHLDPEDEVLYRSAVVNAALPNADLSQQSFLLGGDSPEPGPYTPETRGYRLDFSPEGESVVQSNAGGGSTVTFGQILENFRGVPQLKREMDRLVGSDSRGDPTTNTNSYIGSNLRFFKENNEEYQSASKSLSEDLSSPQSDFMNYVQLSSSWWDGGGNRVTPALEAGMKRASLLDLVMGIDVKGTPDIDPELMPILEKLQGALRTLSPEERSKAMLGFGGEPPAGIPLASIDGQQGTKAAVAPKETGSDAMARFLDSDETELNETAKTINQDLAALAEDAESGLWDVNPDKGVSVSFLHEGVVQAATAEAKKTLEYIAGVQKAAPAARTAYLDVTKNVRDYVTNPNNAKSFLESAGHLWTGLGDPNLAKLMEGAVGIDPRPDPAALAQDKTTTLGALFATGATGSTDGAAIASIYRALAMGQREAVAGKSKTASPDLLVVNNFLAAKLDNDAASIAMVAEAITKLRADPAQKSSVRDSLDPVAQAYLASTKGLGEAFDKATSLKQAFMIHQISGMGN